MTMTEELIEDVESGTEARRPRV